MLTGIQILSIILLCLLSQPTLLWSSTQKPSWSSRVVNTKFGATRGLLFQPKGGYEGVEIYYGLPYATPPVGSLRLMPPVSGSPWSGTKMNEQPAPVCPQILPNIDNETEALRLMPKGRLAQLKRLLPLLRNQSEDCLYLNVYVPLSVAEGQTQDKKLAVLLFVHGEDFGWGAGHAYDPSMLASQGNIIVVTVSFRVGILGFLNANSDGYFKSPANFALLDIIAALHWTQENIGFFGDSRNVPIEVTLMGHGKGAIFVNFLMISSTVPTGLLFHRVILMSGSALSPIASGLSNGKELAKKFAKSVNCFSDEGPSTVLHCLRQIPLQYFLESELWPFFGPSDDGVIIEEGIRENVLRDRLSHYPMIFGVTKAETLKDLSDHDAVYGVTEDKRRQILREKIVEKYYSIHRNEIMAAAIHEYTDWERPVQHPISVRDETLDALADAQVIAPLVKVGDLHSQSNSKSYFYVFEYQSKISDYQQRLGCPSGEDLLYIFGIPLFSDTDTAPSQLGYFIQGNYSKNEIQLSVTVIRLWTNFIRSGNPNEEKSEGESTPSISGRSSSSNEKSAKSRVVEWPPYDPLYKKYLTIDMKPRVRTHYRSHKLAFWLHLVVDLQRNGYGAPSGHHNVHPNPIAPSSNNIPSHPNSGLVILPPEDPTHNSSTPSPPTIQLVGPGPPMWEHNPNQQHGNFYPGNDRDNDEEGYQMYSTALSVTIAIGCSLLILNILIFAAFYYQRDKRRAEEMDNHHHDSSQGMSTMSHHSPPHHAPHGGVAYTKADVNRRKENGQAVQMAQHPGQAVQMPMPNICELPPFDNMTDDSYQQQSYHQGQGGTLKRKQQQNAGQQTYEAPLPDAVMMNAKFDSPECGSVRSCSGPRRSSLTMKDHLPGSGHFSLASGSCGSGSCVSYESGSRTLPRPVPPKRATSTVKFNENPESPTSGSGSATIGVGTVPKSALKKLNYSPHSDELRV